MTTTADAVALVHAYVAAANARDLAALEGVFAPDFVNHHPAGAAHGIDALRTFVAGVLDRWPEFEASVDVAFANTSFADGPRVGALVTLRGADRARGRTLEVREVWIFRVHEGRLAERWYVVEQADPAPR